VRALLGTLDRRHVEAILNALAAQDGAALMACVAQLDERAPDYDQALGELAAAIQRMALLQALPDLRGEDEEQDALLAGLAARFEPEDLQLLYQIAIMARRDLDFAPDARGGFEMALLRMLAFKPDTTGRAMAAQSPRRRQDPLRLHRQRRAVRPKRPRSLPGPRRVRRDRRHRRWWRPATTGRPSSRPSASRALRRSWPRIARMSGGRAGPSGCGWTRMASTTAGRPRRSG